MTIATYPFLAVLLLLLNARSEDGIPVKGRPEMARHRERTPDCLELHLSEDDFPKFQERSIKPGARFRVLLENAFDLLQEHSVAGVVRRFPRGGLRAAEALPDPSRSGGTSRPGSSP